ncbi:uncharacterized protein LOC128547881 [Mercenaria mercenaria]|uniref:uncharacterized protein LOC128547881 n=1 Tax=Mercenaria mercenaria TaxID=6596 RepID=UPI00234F4B28|nr:uncharacterized protein LOC128547881 [Mercenaria mercenaria]XP_053377449.1 uncharacterized protein LOC128547881 [Mercenaria mercenaria]
MIETDLGHNDFEWLPTDELDSVLGNFCAALQTKDGQEYSKSALVGIRAGINRHLTSPNVGRIINIMKDREFMASNQVLTGLVKSLKREGKDLSTHKEPIEDDDIGKLYASGVFDETKPETLQNKVLFDIIGQFGHRGREGLRNLKKSSFVVKNDAKGRKFVQMAYNEADKTHHGIDCKENVKAPRMYESNDEFCPVRSFEKYSKKLNAKLDDFFQRPLIKVTENDETWYAARPVGINTLCNFMSTLSREAGLSKRYTNHCIRAYISTKLFTAGFSNRAFMSVTRHRNEKSLTSYIKPFEDEHQAVSRALYPSSSVVEVVNPEKVTLTVTTISSNSIPPSTGNST